jgi:hypothetical protein
MDEYRDKDILDKDKYGFWELAIKTTLIMAFFPWSLLYCLYFFGMDETIYLYKAIVRDLAVLVVGLVLGLVGLCSIILLIFYLLY